MSERRYKLLNGYTLLVDDEGLSVSHHASILTIETSGDEIIDDVLALLDHTVSEKEKWRKEAFRKYPTPDAYDAACAALHKHKEEANRLELELKQESERCTKVMRLLVQVTDILSMGRTPDRASAALKVIYQWLNDNKPQSQEGDQA
ncbi:hypothetical protein [Paenibacillus sp. FSL K6-0108]|uniref:hypothetical protein n=1 Tax=Paenibacillus sp. FSL K6-0108 TaxID=2921417 RepID=UPI0032510CD4